MLLSLNDLGSGVNSVAAGGKSSGLEVQLGVGRVDMPSMRSAVNDNVSFEIEEAEDATEDENKETFPKAVRRFLSKDKQSNTAAGMEVKNGGVGVATDGRRFSRFRQYDQQFWNLSARLKLRSFTL